MRVRDLQEFLSTFTARDKSGTKQGNAISDAVIFVEVNGFLEEILFPSLSDKQLLEKFFLPKPTGMYDKLLIISSCEGFKVRQKNEIFFIVYGSEGRIRTADPRLMSPVL